MSTIYKRCYTQQTFETLEQTQGEPHAGREATTPSIIIRKREVQRWEETPPNGGVVTPEDIQMQPFIPKGKLNSILNF
jgi:hypothetical protein